MKPITCLLCAMTAVARFWNVRIACSLALWIAVVTGGAEEGFQAVEFETSDGGRIHASLFEGSKNKAVILAHGAVFNKESWYPLALRLKKEGLTSLSIDFRGYGQSTAELKADKPLDVLGAVTFLRSRGYESISQDAFGHRPRAASFQDDQWSGVDRIDF
jgi:pimeloyl-ACP methyl ester carboxylesterase